MSICAGVYKIRKGKSRRTHASWQHKTKRPAYCRPLNFLSTLLLSAEPFNVLLGTNATNRRSSNGLHGETSISLASPPSFDSILNLLSPRCQEKSSLGGSPSVTGSGNTTELLHPSLVIFSLSLDRQRGARGGFINITTLRSLFISPCQRGITEGLPLELSNGRLKFRSGPVR